jgi:V/A-type H+-transporting ATPase subunit I
MFRPEKMSLLRISIHRSQLPSFLNEIPKFPYFHIKEYMKEKQPLGVYRRERAIISENKEIIDKKIHDVEENLIYIFNQLSIDPDTIKLHPTDQKVTFEAESVEELINLLHNRTENDSRRIKGYLSDYKRYSDQLDHDEMMNVLLEWLLKFKISKKVLDYFKLYKFQVFSVTDKNFHDVLLAMENEDIPIVIQHFRYKPGLVLFFLIYHNVHAKSVQELMSTFKVNEITDYSTYLTPDGVVFDELEKDLIFCRDRLERAKNLIEDAKNNVLQYRAYMEVLDNIRNYLKMEEQFLVGSENLLIRLEAFVPTRDEAKIVETLLKKYQNKIRIFSEVVNRDIENSNQEKSDKDDLEESAVDELEQFRQEVKQIEKVPSLLIPKKIFKPFKLLVNLYGTTGYSEIDPTPIVAFTYPLLFGLMFGDLGHGLTLLLTGLLVVFMMRKNKEKSMYDFGFILIWLGVGAMIFGLWYGEFFGNELYLLPHHLRPLENISTILKLAVLIGVVHICLGWFLNGINFILKKRVYLAFADPFMKCVLIIGGTYLLFTYFFNLQAWLSPPYPILYVMIPALFLLIAKPIGKSVFRIKYFHESVGALIGESTLDLGETFLGILSNVASYSRLLALSMAHLGLMIIVSIMVESVSNMPFLVPFVLILGNLFVIVLEGMLAFINTLRLHFYEFFGKFYAGNGIAYHNTRILTEFSEIHFITPNITKSAIF